MKLRCAYCKEEFEVTKKKALNAFCPGCHRPAILPDEFMPKTGRSMRFKLRRKDAPVPTSITERLLNMPPVLTSPRSLLLMVVVGAMVIMGIVFLSPEKVAIFDSSPQGIARRELTVVWIALQRYHRDCGRFPTPEDGDLKALLDNPGIKAWRGPYVTLLRPDPWKNWYTYHNDGTNCTLLSTGPDGIDGSDDDLKPLPVDSAELKRLLTEDLPKPGSKSTQPATKSKPDADINSLIDDVTSKVAPIEPITPADTNYPMVIGNPANPR